MAAALAALKAELAKGQKRKTEETNNGNKYMRRGDLEKIAIQKEQELKKSEAPKIVEEPVVKEPEPQIEEKEPTAPIPLSEVIKRLRQRNEPITLFAESEWQRYQRLHHLEESDPMEYIEGMDNDFAREIRNAEEEDHPEDRDNKRKKEQEDDFHESQSKTSGSYDNIGEIPNGRTMNKEKEEFILVLLKTMLSQWEQELNDRPDLEKRTAQGKVATATYKQCRKHIKPLFKLLREKGLPKDILDAIHHICCFIQEREYVKANDTYLQMAIGNAPWPMGVTMVGIHERSAREKIFSNQVAHVLNDETQRKYIQAIKRIMTWAQRKYPNDPSKCVG